MSDTEEARETQPDSLRPVLPALAKLFAWLFAWLLVGSSVAATIWQRLAIELIAALLVSTAGFCLAVRPNETDRAKRQALVICSLGCIIVAIGLSVVGLWFGGLL